MTAASAAHAAHRISMDVRRAEKKGDALQPSRCASPLPQLSPVVCEAKTPRRACGVARRVKRRSNLLQVVCVQTTWVPCIPRARCLSGSTQTLFLAFAKSSHEFCIRRMCAALGVASEAWLGVCLQVHLMSSEN